MSNLLETFLIGGITGAFWGGIAYFVLDRKKSKTRKDSDIISTKHNDILEDDPNPPKTPQEAWDRLINKAGYYYKSKDFAKGITVAIQALDFSRQNFGNTHENTASTLNNLALLYQEQENFSEAEAHLKKALEIYETTLGRRHEKTLIALKNLYALSVAQCKAKK